MSNHELQKIALQKGPPPDQKDVLNKFFMFANFKGGFEKNDINDIDDEARLKQAAINTLTFAQNITDTSTRQECFVEKGATGGGIKYLNKKPKRRRHKSRKKNKNNTKINRNTSIRRTSLKRNRKKHTKRKK